MMTVKHEIDKYFGGDSYRYFIFIRTYSRFLEDKSRRETWEEVVDRYMKFMKKRIGRGLSTKEYDEVREYILIQKVMPSMRLLWAAGEAAEKNEASVFNCSYLAINKLVRFRELLFLLCSGCGVGFSVEQAVIDNLPKIESQTGNKLPTFEIPDSREGWADALHAGITAWYDGNDIDFNFDKIRPLGSRLKTFGGRASGSGPLKDLLHFVRKIILDAQGRKLRSIEVYDICTKTANIIVAGGTRRSSLLSLSDLHDDGMRDAKSGNFYIDNSHRSMANNSISYNTKPSMKEFMEEWINLMKSGTGERGIFNREGAIKSMPERRRTILKVIPESPIGVNPCSEILLRSCSFCNLTSVVCREDDTERSLLKKIRIATILGTYQSMFSNFHYLTRGWKNNCEEERLLGVSLNGQFDCPVIMKDDGRVLRKLRDYAVNVNKKYASKFKINPSVSVCAIKPEGTGSQMLNCSSGAHPRYAKYYIRRVRISGSDPLFGLLKDSGIAVDPEVGYTRDSTSTWVIGFPIKSPDNAIVRDDVSALDQLEHWKKIKINYVEHTVSTTVYVGKNEWIDVGKWVWDNWDVVSGLSFLPKEDDEHIYELAPYTEIDVNTYKKTVKGFPEIDFSTLGKYELDDQTTGAQELACSSGVCIEDDIVPDNMKDKLV